MDKQYSVNMQDGEVVSVVVDGVAYSDVAEIDDTEDRTKVEQMIERMGNTHKDGFDPGLEQDFQAEFARMQRQGTVFSRLIAAIFLGIGVLCLVIAAVSALGAVKQLGREVEAPGQVVDMVMRQSRDSETNVLQAYYYPVVAFDGVDGVHQEVQLAEGSRPAAYGEGDGVTVLYDPAKPREARIKSAASTLLLWLLPLITGLVGTVFGVVGLVIFRVRQPEPAWA